MSLFSKQRQRMFSKTSVNDVVTMDYFASVWWCYNLWMILDME